MSSPDVQPFSQPQISPDDVSEDVFVTPIKFQDLPYNSDVEIDTDDEVADDTDDDGFQKELQEIRLEQVLYVSFLPKNV